MDFELHKEILDSWPTSILFCDLDHVIRYMNRASRKHFYGARTYQDLIGTDVMQYHLPETREKILALVEGLKAGGGARRMGTVRGEGYRVYLVPVREEDGTLIGYCQHFVPATLDDYDYQYEG